MVQFSQFFRKELDLLNHMKNMKLEFAAPLIFFTVFILMFIVTLLEPKIEHVNQEFLKANIGQPGVIVVDVREEEIYNGKSPFKGLPGGHIKGAINFPYNDLKIKAASAALAQAGVTKKVSIILYCDNGIVSEIFGETLVRDFGYSASLIKNYKGGIKDWVKDNNNKLYPEDHQLDFQEEDEEFEENEEN